MQEENDTEDKSVSLSTANLLSRVDSCTSEEGGSGNDDEEEMVYTSSSNNNNNQNSNATAKLRQLLDASPRADAVAAG